MAKVDYRFVNEGKVVFKKFARGLAVTFCGSERMLCPKFNGRLHPVTVGRGQIRYIICDLHAHLSSQ